MRHYAKVRGYSLSDHGIVSSTKQGSNNIVRGTQNLAPATCEADIFEWLDVHAKEERSMTRQISDALKRRGFYRRRVRKSNRIMNMWVTDDPYYDSNARELSRDWN